MSINCIRVIVARSSEKLIKILFFNSTSKFCIDCKLIGTGEIEITLMD